jgi:hypothetical protein
MQSPKVRSNVEGWNTILGVGRGVVRFWCVEEEPSSSVSQGSACMLELRFILLLQKYLLGIETFLRYYLHSSVPSRQCSPACVQHRSEASPFSV